MRRRRMERLLQPRVIAAFGGSTRPESPGFALMRNLSDGFKGTLYAVNPKYQKVQGYPCYPRLSQAPEAPDIAIVVTPAHSVLRIVHDCGEAQVAGLIVLSSFFESDFAEKRALYTQLHELCRKYRMRLLGPSSLGIIQPHLGIRATLTNTPVFAGNLALITQSGALGEAVLDWAHDRQVGLSQFISVGAMVDLDFADLIDYLGSDYRTACILIYMETLIDARRFLSAARAFALSKPILVLKSGRSQDVLPDLVDAFSRKTPTNAQAFVEWLAPPDTVFGAAFRRAGVLRVDTVSQLFNCAQALAMQPRPKGARLAVLTNAAGPGLLATDYLFDQGGEIATLRAEDRAELAKAGTILRPSGPALTLTRSAGPEDYERTLLKVLQSSRCDGVLVVFAPYANQDPAEVVRVVVQAAKRTRKTVLAGFMGESAVREARHLLEAAKIPDYRFPESAVDTFLRMYRYHQNLQLLQETPGVIPLEQDFDTQAVRDLFARVRADGRTQLSEAEGRAVLEAYHLPGNPFRVVTQTAAAVAFAEEVGYPVVMKIVSPDIPDKSRIGGVRLNLRDADDVVQTFVDLIRQTRQRRPGARIEGVLVEKQLQQRFELLLAARRDPVFGSVVIFGRGGRNAHLYPDVQVGLPPLNQALARRLIERLRQYPLLSDVNTQGGVDLFALEMTLVRFAYLLADFPDIAAMTINPYMVDEQGGVAVDATIALTADPPRPKMPYDHLVITPYPAQYIKEVTLRDGQRLVLRPIRPEDEPLERVFLREDTSRESLYYRFFGQVPSIDHGFLTRFTQIDYSREMAIVALEPKPDGTYRMVGVVRIVGEILRESAEYAILIADEYQGRGLGRILTEYILHIGREMGLKVIQASVLATNKAMLGLFKKFGFTLEREDFETYHVELQLDQPPA